MKEYKYNHLTDEAAEAILLEFADTEYYLALLRYIDKRDAFAVASLLDIDPFHKPTQIAKMQGIHEGLRDIPAYLERLRDSRKEDKGENE